MKKMITIAAAAVLMTACADQQDTMGISTNASPEYAVSAVESQAIIRVSTGIEFIADSLMVTVFLDGRFSETRNGGQTLEFPLGQRRSARRVEYNGAKKVTTGFSAIAWAFDGRTWTIKLNQLNSAGNRLDKSGTAVNACSSDVGCRAAVITW